MSTLFSPGYYTENDLKNEGFKKIGVNVRISKNCTIIGLKNISIGDNVLIDGYSTLVANSNYGIDIGSFIHIGSYCLLSGGLGITMEDFSGLAQSVHIYSKTDDFSGEHLTNPMVPAKYLGVTGGRVVLKEHVIIGSHSVILPKVILGEGSSVGSLSLVNKNLNPWEIYFGIPARKIGERSKNLLDLKNQLLEKLS